MKRIPMVCVIRGVPNSGKSEFLKKNFPEAFVCSANGFRTEYSSNRAVIQETHDLCRNLFLQALDEKHPIIAVKNTNIKRWHFYWYLEKAREAGYAVVVIRMRTKSINTSIPDNPYDPLPEKIAQLYAAMEGHPGEIYV